MNRERLVLAQNIFYSRYPEGFDDQKMQVIMKKHNIEKMQARAAALLSAEAFGDRNNVFESVKKIIMQSSLVSVFEKMRLRDLLKDINVHEAAELIDGMFEYLHGKQDSGFRILSGFLERFGLAKWPIVTVCGLYHNPERDVLIKPTTVKRVISYYKLEELKYVTKPDWNFYDSYRSRFIQMKSLVSAGLQVDNAVFSGFLMIGMETPDE